MRAADGTGQGLKRDRPGRFRLADLWLRASLEPGEAAALAGGLLELEDYELAGEDPPLPLLEATRSRRKIP